ncbi:MAG: hypothetical protein AAFV33_08240 [Chloroflexota bacterium]
MQIDAYHAFTERLTTNLQADEHVRGLVLLGSTASQGRSPDEWSDHDFFVITASGLQEDFRTRFDWLPAPNAIVLTVRETVHGLKVLYADGHLLEYAVLDVEEIALAKANDYAVAFDRGGVTDAMQKIAPSDPAATSDPQHDMGLFLCLLVVGVGRVARGEIISGGVFIRTYAVAHLLPLLATAQGSPLPDNLDPFRRFEQTFPDIGVEVNAALSREPIDAALGLLDVFEHSLQDTSEYPAAGVETVRDTLMRIEQQRSPSA